MDEIAELGVIGLDIEGLSNKGSEICGRENDGPIVTQHRSRRRFFVEVTCTFSRPEMSNPSNSSIKLQCCHSWKLTGTRAELLTN